MNQPSRPGVTAPLLSVILVNYNGKAWLERCLGSLREQTLFDRCEVIVADNASPDGSLGLAARLMQDWPSARTIQHGANLGYSEGNNLASAHARGEYLFFVNSDAWLERDCLERLLAEAQSAQAAVAAPLVFDYTDDRIQTDASREGFDVFGLLSGTATGPERREIFVAGGCALLARADWFRKLGGFDPVFFMYADEHDLCWRVWAAGGRVVLVPSAKLHHRSAAAVNPRGGGSILEVRTSDSKRFYANRNGLLVVLKSARNLLLAMVPLQLLLLGIEGLVMWGLTRRWSHFRRGYLAALGDCWRLRGHVLAERRRLGRLRRRGDVWMLRFLRVQPNRWRELRRCWRLGPPKVDRT